MEGEVLEPKELYHEKYRIQKTNEHKNILKKWCINIQYTVCLFYLKGKAFILFGRQRERERVFNH